MVNEATLSRLYEMKLSAMASYYRQQMEDNGIHRLSFDERFGLLVDTEWTTRKNNRLKRLINSAGFPISGACVEDIEYRSDRKLDREQINIWQLENSGSTAWPVFHYLFFPIQPCRGEESMRKLRGIY